MPLDDRNPIRDAEILQSLRSSGYPLEQEIASALAKKGWDFSLNYAFTDIETNDSREIDVLAERRLWDKNFENIIKTIPENQITSKVMNRWVTIKDRVRLNAELLIECKKLKSPVVFLSRTKQPKDFLPSSSDDIVQYSGVKPEIHLRPGYHLDTHYFSLGQLLRFGKISHYAKCLEKATQFCKVYKKNQRLIADHGEIYQSFILPLIKATEYQKAARKVKSGWSYYDMYIHYPLLIIDGEILKANTDCTSLEAVNHVELVRNYYSDKISGTYRIDVLRKDYFPEFVEKILMPSLSAIQMELKARENIVANGKAVVSNFNEFFETLF